MTLSASAVGLTEKAVTSTSYKGLPPIIQCISCKFTSDHSCPLQQERLKTAESVVRQSVRKSTNMNLQKKKKTKQTININNLT